MTSKEVITKASEIDMHFKAAQSTMSTKDADKLMNFLINKPKQDNAKSSSTTKNDTQIKEQKLNQTPKDTQNSTKPKAKSESEDSDRKEDKPKEKENKNSSNNSTNKNSNTKRTKDKLGKIGLRRRGPGLTFVKRNRPAKDEASKTSQELTESNTTNRPKPKINTSDALNNLFKTETSENDRKRKKPKSASPKRATNKGEFLSFDRDLGNTHDSGDIFEDEVLLVDISQVDMMKEKEEKETPKQPKSNAGKGKGSSGNKSGGKRKLKREKRTKIRKAPKVQEEITKAVIPEDIRVYEFAEKIGKTTSEIISKLFGLGLMLTKNDFLESDVLEILGEEFGIEIEVKDELEELSYEDKIEDKEEHLESRPPVITIMGHVDHGKTSLLDAIRSSDIAHKESGGITQHIGAYSIERNSHKLTFIDTPGHAAFSQMRERGAKITDIVIIVVAADDGVKPQTIEAIKHVKNSDVSVLVAVNKMDKPQANPDLVMSQMAENGITPVEWGGEYEFVKISAKSGEGLDELLDTVLLQAEIMELKANPDKKAQAVVIESSIEKGKGVVATVIVQNGTLHLSDNVVADTTYGRVKAIVDDMGNKLKSIPPSGTAKILGLNNTPSAGSSLAAMDSDKEARDIATKRAEHKRQKELSKSTKVSIEELSGLIAEGKIKSLPVILKGDVQGSVEALKNSLDNLRNDEVKVNIISASVGGITENDIALASASENTLILGFNIRPTGAIKNKAKAEGVEIKTYSIIYDLLNDVKDLLAGMMSPITREENSGQAEVKETFTIAKVGTIAGCLVTDGSVIRGGKARVIRDGIVIYETTISSLKRFKDEAKEVTKGYECGIMLDNFNDIKIGDYIETFIKIEEQAKYESKEY
jgi:translation initiation factor IF-2